MQTIPQKCVRVVRHVVAQDTAYGWPWAETEVYVADESDHNGPWYCCRRLADDLIVGADNTVRGSLENAEGRLQKLAPAS